MRNAVDAKRQPGSARERVIADSLYRMALAPHGARQADYCLAIVSGIASRPDRWGNENTINMENS
jgi:hypothetical protein